MGLLRKSRRGGQYLQLAEKSRRLVGKDTRVGLLSWLNQDAYGWIWLFTFFFSTIGFHCIVLCWCILFFDWGLAILVCSFFLASVYFSRYFGSSDGLNRSIVFHVSLLNYFLDVPCAKYRRDSWFWRCAFSQCALSLD